MAEKIKTGYILAGLGALGGIIYLIAKAKEAPPAPPPDEPTATIVIEVIGAEHNSPVMLTEGESYTVRLTITNRSTKAGEPWAADLHIIISAATYSYTLIPPQDTIEHFSAGQTRIFDYFMDIPVGSGGESGAISVTVADPIGIPIVTATEPVNIAIVEIVYGATVVIGA